MNLNQQIEQWLQSRNHVHRSDQRPYVTLCYAQSLDGSLTTRQGESLSLSGPESFRLTHQLRSLHDGILVGIGTVLSDNPRLTVREWSGPNPQPVVLDSQLRMPPGAMLCQHPDRDCWVVTGRTESAAPGDRVNIISIELDATDRLPLDMVLMKLHEKGINTLMVEGGASVISSFLRARLVDSLVLTVAPRLIGGYHAVSGLGNEGLTNLPVIKPPNTARLGHDLIVWGDLQYSGVHL